MKDASIMIQLYLALLYSIFVAQVLFVKKKKIKVLYQLLSNFPKLENWFRILKTCYMHPGTQVLCDPEGVISVCLSFLLYKVKLVFLAH